MGIVEMVLLRSLKMESLERMGKSISVSSVFGFSSFHKCSYFVILTTISVLLGIGKLVWLQLPSVRASICFS